MSKKGSIDQVHEHVKEHVEEHVEPDTEHVSRRAGTLLVAAVFDKSELENHHIERMDTKAIAHLKKTPDGKTILIPQPTDDPEQSLNWSWRKKHTVLFALTYCTLMTDLTSAWTIPLVLPQANYWGITPSNAGRNLSGNIFMLGVGGIAAVPITRWLGRLPVLFWSILLAFFMTIFASAAPTWISYIVARCLQGFFVTAPQVVGLSMIHDMFFFHEHARKIGIWAGTFIFSPYAGPFISGIVANYTSWRNSSWLNAGLLGIGVVLVAVLGDETFYDSETRRNYQPPNNDSKLVSQAKKLVGITGYKAHHTGVGSAARDMCIMVSRPHFLLLCFFYMFTFMWAIGLNATLVLFIEPPPPQGYGYSQLTVALFYLAPMIAAVVGELFGHWFNDFIANRHIRKSGGTYDPEVRLWTTWISVCFCMGGLVLFGYALERKMVWIALIMAWAMYSFGIVTETVAITAYSLDVFPDHGVEAAAIINMFRTSGGFIVNYFQVSWATTSGPIVSFGSEAGIVAAAFCLVLLVQTFGGTWRERFPSPTKY